MIRLFTLRNLFLCTQIVLLAGSVPPRANGQPPPDMIVPPGLEDRFIVTFTPGMAASDRLAVAWRAGAIPLVELGLINAVAVRISDLQILAALQGDAVVLNIVPDRKVYALQSSPRGAASISAISTMETIPQGVVRVGEPATGSEGAGVGVLIGDTGIDWTHPDLRVAGQMFDAFGGDCMDRHGHGTHVAGTAAALMNGYGVVGVAPGATLYCGKVLADNGAGSDSNIIELLQWVVSTNAAGADPPIRVVNLSLGRSKQGGDMGGPVHEAIRAAYNAGVVVIVAAGNDPSVEVKDQVPAGFPEVIAVASTTAEDGARGRCPFYRETIPADTASYFTTDGAFDNETGIGVSISAPGGTRESVNIFCRMTCEGILSTAIGGGTTATLGGSPACGTSMAAPHVAGLVARLIEAGLDGPENIRARLRSDAMSAGASPSDSISAAYTYDGEREGIAAWRP